MKWTSRVMFVGLVAAIMLIAAGGHFQPGVLLAIALTLLICVMEPSIAR